MLKLIFDDVRIQLRLAACAWALATTRYRSKNWLEDWHHSQQFLKVLRRKHRLRFEVHVFENMDIRYAQISTDIHRCIVSAAQTLASTAAQSPTPSLLGAAAWALATCEQPKLLQAVLQPAERLLKCQPSHEALLQLVTWHIILAQ